MTIEAGDEAGGARGRGPDEDLVRWVTGRGLEVAIEEARRRPLTPVAVHGVDRAVAALESAALELVRRHAHQPSSAEHRRIADAARRDLVDAQRRLAVTGLGVAEQLNGSDHAQRLARAAAATLATVPAAAWDERNPATPAELSREALLTEVIGLVAGLEVLRRQGDAVVVVHAPAHPMHPHVAVVRNDDALVGRLHLQPPDPDGAQRRRFENLGFLPDPDQPGRRQAQWRNGSPVLDAGLRIVALLVDVLGVQPPSLVLEVSVGAAREEA